MECIRNWLGDGMPSLGFRKRSPVASGGPRAWVWRWPVLLAALSVFGLLSALLGQGGIWWILSWIALSMPLAMIVRCVWLRPAGGRAPPARKSPIDAP